MTDSILYDFKTGYPNLSLVPRERLSQFAADALMSGRGLQYGGDLSGSTRSREQIAHLLTDMYDAPIGINELIVTTGALHSIDVVCRALTQPGDVVLVESPTFYFGVTIIQMSRVEIIGVPMGTDGIDLNKLEDALKHYGRRVKIVYTIPVFHNPTGICATVENRKGLVELAKRHDFTILEDATYQPLYFGATPPPPLIRSFDDAECVVTVASVSKLLMPAIRVGWIYAAPNKIALIKKFKGDGATSLLNTEIVASYIESGEFTAQIEFARRFYARKHDLMVAALDRYAPDWLEWSAPAGGYFVWATLPEGVSVTKLYERALACGVDFFVGSASYADGNDDSHLRLCFAYVDDDLITKGIAVLSECLRELRG